MSCNELSFENVSADATPVVIIVAASTGDGDPPDNAAKFYVDLRSVWHCKELRSPPGVALRACKYGMDCGWCVEWTYGHPVASSNARHRHLTSHIGGASQLLHAVEWDLRAHRRRTQPSGRLTGVNFTILGLGDSNYTRFCHVPRSMKVCSTASVVLQSASLQHV